ncbi:transporter substrate-binding domain-containing protein [Marinobacteraceae bacterium S3BR75-40.1]
MKWRLLALFLMGLTATPVLADSVLTLWARNFYSPPIRALLQLALDETPEYPELTIEPSVPMVQGRVVVELARNNSDLVDVANIATSRDRESELTTVRFPVDSGLLGMRVCLIRKGEADRFAGIERPSQFQRRGLVIGQGTHWPDKEILEANGFEVVTAARFKTLFQMLRRERFDCFLRGVGEVLFDLEQQGSEGLQIEPHLLFSYKMPSYFFFAPRDEALAQRIQLGLERAVADGRYDKFFRHYFGRALTKLDISSRQRIPLFNPLLTEDSRFTPYPVNPMSVDPPGMD